MYKTSKNFDRSHFGQNKSHKRPTCRIEIDPTFDVVEDVYYFMLSFTVLLSLSTKFNISVLLVYYCIIVMLSFAV